MINFIVKLFEESIKMQSTLHEGIIRRFSSSTAKLLTGGLTGIVFGVPNSIEDFSASSSRKISFKMSTWELFSS